MEIRYFFLGGRFLCKRKQYKKDRNVIQLFSKRKHIAEQYFLHR
nr:MAG TPA: hypothetical protein [Caudoviricetes sp.]